MFVCTLNWVICNCFNWSFCILFMFIVSIVIVHCCALYRDILLFLYILVGLVVDMLLIHLLYYAYKRSS